LSSINGVLILSSWFGQVAVFKDPESQEYKEFLNVADELRSEYNFTHTFDSSYVPDTGVDLSAPAVRLYKNFDEGFSDATVSPL
jgi:protein disulfide-isomerase A1